jgi:hypothetical protein
MQGIMQLHTATYHIHPTFGDCSTVTLDFFRNVKATNHGSRLCISAPNEFPDSVFEADVASPCKVHKLSFLDKFQRLHGKILARM